MFPQSIRSFYISTEWIRLQRRVFEMTITVKSHIRRTNTQNFDVSRLVLQLPLPKLLMQDIKPRM